MLKSEELKITTIIENTSNSINLLGQAGFCVHIKAGNFPFKK